MRSPHSPPHPQSQKTRVFNSRRRHGGQVCAVTPCSCEGGQWTGQLRGGGGGAVVLSLRGRLEQGRELKNASNSLSQRHPRGLSRAPRLPR